MALPPQATDQAFLREVDEGVRRDQVVSLWRRYGLLGIAVLILFLGAVGGGLWWRAEQSRRAGVAGEDFLQVIDKLGVGDRKAALPVLDRLAVDGPAGYRPLAQMMQAADAVSGNATDAGGSTDNQRAIRKLDAVAADASVAQPLRDAALIRSVRLGYDSLPPSTIIARLHGLSVPGNPWFGIAGEMTALAHLKAGAPEQAKPLLIAIVRDTGNPASLRGRAAELALSLGVDAASLQLPKPVPTPNSDSAPAAAAAK